MATDLPEIRRFNTEHGNVVTAAGDADAFSAAIQRALEGPLSGEVERRIAAAHENSWQTRILAMKRSCEARVHP